MKYPAILYVLPLCITIFLAGCNVELPWGNCGPRELSERVPLGVTFALERALLPYGMIGGFVENGTLSCDDIQSITYGPAYRWAFFNTEVHSASSEDIFEFQDRYEFEIYCHGQGMCSGEVARLFGVWRVVMLRTVETPSALPLALEALENYLGPDFSNCTRGLIGGCAIVTDKQGITRFYPLHPDDSVWGDTQGKKIGEFSLTKEEFFEWYDSCAQNPDCCGWYHICK